MKQIKLKITSELSSYLQSLYYEVQMREEVVQKLIMDASLQGRQLADMPVLKEYEQETIERTIKLDTALKEVKNNILPMFDGKDVVFNVNFIENCLDITLRDKESEKIYEDNKDYFQGVKSCTLE